MRDCVLFVVGARAIEKWARRGTFRWLSSRPVYTEQSDVVFSVGEKTMGALTSLEAEKSDFFGAALRV